MQPVLRGQRQDDSGGKPYAPVDVLTNMGFEEDLARVAIAAAGGDVDRAVRIMLEDAKAHNAREAGEWEFLGDQGWAAFDIDTDRLLQEAYSRGDSACELKVAGNRYLVDFDAFTQLNIASKRTRRVRRRGAAAGRSSSDAAPSGSSSSPVVHERSSVKRAEPLGSSGASSSVSARASN